mmetsp:Transcript_10551/g.16220  ORF Transcript_10551/g.16220 Transcript_10551/m.16220 type:complete len:165 (+) Transcript_10551:202-696(+)|eukprot:CAMPEP_0195266336 /NCGR_PEP_ID=MMETSP0706-20130129/11953_1 /TAXON_ID=33640 /ORGANISM="Asterionellopsis glacialis, Strain CCMP134" /LENGTH=164 /DNA_ID=CAMNT_0040320915 /DNA_START=151 /DNA_END=645 /DNA_ORIENTATION=+
MRLSSSCIESSCSTVERTTRRTSQCASPPRKLAVPKFYDSDDDESDDEEEEVATKMGFAVPIYKRQVPAFYDSDDESDEDDEEDDYPPSHHQFPMNNDYDSFHHGSPTSTATMWLSSPPSSRLNREDHNQKSHIKHFVPAFDDDFLSDSVDEFMSDAVGLDLDF